MTLAWRLWFTAGPIAYRYFSEPGEHEPPGFGLLASDSSLYPTVALIHAGMPVSSPCCNETTRGVCALRKIESAELHNYVAMLWRLGSRCTSIGRYL